MVPGKPSIKGVGSKFTDFFIFFVNGKSDRGIKVSFIYQISSIQHFNIFKNVTIGLSLNSKPNVSSTSSINCLDMANSFQTTEMNFATYIALLICSNITINTRNR